MKKPFKETKGGKILKGVLNGVLDVAPIPDVRQWFDKDKDGKVNWQDVKQFKGVDYLKIAGGVGFLAVLVRYDIVNFEQVVELLKLFLGA